MKTNAEIDAEVLQLGTQYRQARLAQAKRQADEPRPRPLNADWIEQDYNGRISRLWESCFEGEISGAEYDQRLQELAYERDRKLGRR